MALDTDALQRLLCEKLCEDVRLTRRRDGALMLRTRFEFPDGDRFPIHVSETGSDGVRISDCGHTLMHLSYDHDLDAFLAGTRRQLLERIVKRPLSNGTKGYSPWILPSRGFPKRFSGSGRR